MWTCCVNTTPRLNGYRALAIVSIHNDLCEYVNDEATGFKVAAALNTHDINRANRLTACLVDRYQNITDMSFHAGSITADMREYHSFHEIDPTTVAAIIETGFLQPGPGVPHQADRSCGKGSCGRDLVLCTK